MLEVPTAIRSMEGRVRKLSRWAFSISLSIVPTLAFADVVSFGPLVSTSQIDLTGDYDGFTWGPAYSGGFYYGWVVIPNGLYDGAYDDTYGAPSGGAASPSIGGSYITRNSPFTFEGAYFASWALDDSLASFSSTSITVSGYNAADQLIGQVSTTLSPSGYNFLSADFNDVTEVVFAGTGGSSGNAWLMDDLVFSTAEPSTLAVLGIGLAGLVAQRRRRSICRSGVQL